MNVFRPKLEYKDDDPLIGWTVTGRFRVLQRVHQDDFSRLYIGVDITDDTTVGVRVALNRHSHTRMLEWLARAMLTSGKHAILAIGHSEKDKIMYVVLSEAALDIIRQPKAQQLEAEEGEGAVEDDTDPDSVADGEGQVDDVKAPI